jgi:hypothetical protein
LVVDLSLKSYGWSSLFDLNGDDGDHAATYRRAVVRFVVGLKRQLIRDVGRSSGAQIKVVVF